MMHTLNTLTTAPRTDKLSPLSCKNPSSSYKVPTHIRSEALGAHRESLLKSLRVSSAKNLMRPTFVFLLLITLALLPSFSKAQTSVVDSVQPVAELATSTSLPLEPQHVRRHFIGWDHMALLTTLSNGWALGFEYQYALTEKLSIGGSAAKSARRTMSQDGSEFQFDFANYNLEARYKFAGFAETGVYVGLAISSYGSKVAANFNGFGNGEKESRSTELEYTHAIVPRLGYLMVGDPKIGRSFSEISVDYGPGPFDVTYSYSAVRGLHSGPLFSTMRLEDRPSQMNLRASIGIRL